MVKSLLLGGEGAGRADEGEQSFSEIFVQRMSLRTSDRRHWCGNPFFPWLPLWGSCHGVTERVNMPSPPLRDTSPIGRGK